MCALEMMKALCGRKSSTCQDAAPGPGEAMRELGLELGPSGGGQTQDGTAWG